MKTNLGWCLLIAAVFVSFLSCKKDKTDSSIDGRFQGVWKEDSQGLVSLVVTQSPTGDASTPNMWLNVASQGYPFVYHFNSVGDSIYLTSNEATNKGYKITFSNNNKTISIKRFHSTLPNIDPVVFSKTN